MKIILKNAGKRFHRTWVFRNANLEFNSGNSYVVLGPNGSGKSTFLQTLTGFLSLSEGSIQFIENEKEIAVEDIFRFISFASPYMELIEELTLKETVEFHKALKPFLSNYSEVEVMKKMKLEEHADKQIKNFSSGMKQRVRLSLCILSDAPIVFLDEPLSNLDQEGKNWYKAMMDEFALNRLILVGSNHQLEEYFFCKEQVQILDLK